MVRLLYEAILFILTALKKLYKLRKDNNKFGNDNILLELIKVQFKSNFKDKLDTITHKVIKNGSSK